MYPQASLLLYQWSSSRDVAQEELFVSQSALQWTPEEMILWLETLGPELSSKSFQEGSSSDRYSGYQKLMHLCSNARLTVYDINK